MNALTVYQQQYYSHNWTPLPSGAIKRFQQPHFALKSKRHYRHSLNDYH